MSTDERKMPKELQEIVNAEPFRPVVPGVWILPGNGNAFAIEGDEGIVIMDTGPESNVAVKMIEALRSVTNKPVQFICYSHGHVGYNFGINDWVEHNLSRGEARPTIVAHENCRSRFARYRETLGLQQVLLAMQMGGARKPVDYVMVDPDLTFDSQIVLPVKGRRIELIWVPSETDCAIALWLPEERLVYTGAAFPGVFMPNIGTPLRSQRFTVRWAQSCEKIAALNPAILVQEFGPVIVDPEEIQRRLIRTANYLRWFRREVVTRMNRGMNEREILEDMTYPEEFDTMAYMHSTYGAPEYIVRDLYREENGWWDRNPTTLHPASTGDAGDAILSALTDPSAVIRRAEQLRDEGQVQLAMHVIDLLVYAGTVTPEVLEARHLKAELCRLRSEEVKPYPSRGLYRASAKRLDKGKTDWLSLFDNRGSKNDQ